MARSVVDGDQVSRAVAAQGRWDSCLPIMKPRVSTLMTRLIPYHVARLEGRGEFQGKGAMPKSHVSNLLGRVNMAQLMTWNATGHDDGAAKGQVQSHEGGGPGISCS